MANCSLGLSNNKPQCVKVCSKCVWFSRTHRDSVTSIFYKFPVCLHFPEWLCYFQLNTGSYTISSYSNFLVFLLYYSFFFSISKTFTYSSHFVSEGRYNLGFPGGSTVKNPPANTGDLRDASSISGSGRFPLEEGTATHSSILAWEIPWRGAWQAV